MHRSHHAIHNRRVSCALQMTADFSIFAFALNLEYLESDFYSWMVYVRPLPCLSPVNLACSPCLALDFGSLDVVRVDMHLRRLGRQTDLRQSEALHHP